MAIALSVGMASAAGCADSTAPGDDGGGDPPPVTAIRLERVTGGLEAPVHLTAPAGDARLFIVEQRGRIRIFEGGQLRATPFLDITDRVGFGGERGLFSVAFHPRYSTNGFVYVDYTDRTGATRVERYTVTANPAVADPTSAKLILTVAQPFANHNGGQIEFGPDGRLYIALGDGGSAGDPLGHGQNRGTLLGSLLRVDVDAGDPFAVPPDNPFVGTAGARPEIWAWGLRNPWRFSFDRPTGMLYIADVGQNRLEEINAERATAGGLNYGWNRMEGTQCFNAATCDQTGLTSPVLEYGHSEGCSVTGGHVYRGTTIPAVAGHYFYADFCAGWIRSFRLVERNVEQRMEWPVGSIGQVLSFGVDGAGELYVLAVQGNAGAVHRFVRGQ